MLSFLNSTRWSAALRGVTSAFARGGAGTANGSGTLGFIEGMGGAISRGGARRGAGGLMEDPVPNQPDEEHGEGDRSQPDSSDDVVAELHALNHVSVIAWDILYPDWHYFD